MPFPKSQQVSAGQDALAQQYNDVREDALKGEAKDFIFGETIEERDALYLETVNRKFEEVVQTSHNDTNYSSDGRLLGQTFSVIKPFKVTKLILSLARRYSYGGTIIVSIRNTDANGLPTGGDLVSASVSASSLNNTNSSPVPLNEHSFITFEFSTPILLSPGTMYAIILTPSPMPSDPKGVWWSRQTGNPYADGHSLFSPDNGVTWTKDTSIDYRFRIEQITDTGKVYKTNASFNDERIHNFVGFAGESGLVNETKKVQIGGRVTGFSGLKETDFLFLSDTPGAISNVPGTFTKKIGRALSDSELRIIEESALLFEPGENLLISANTSRTRTDPGLVKVKEIKINRGGVLRIKFDITNTGEAGAVTYAQVFRNGSPIGTPVTSVGGTRTISEDIQGWRTGDLVQLYIQAQSTATSTTISNFRIYVGSLESGVVNLD